MDKSTLIHSASILREIPPPAAARFEEIIAACAADLTSAMRTEPKLTELIGEGNIEVMATNHDNHFKYMSATCALFDPTSFVETVLWVLRTYRARGFSMQYWDVMLPRAAKILHKHLEPEYFAEIRPFYDWLQDNIAAFAQLSEEENSVFERMGGLHEGDR